MSKNLGTWNAGVLFRSFVFASGFWLAMATASEASAQTNVLSHTNATAKTSLENRYLLVVETSRASRARLDGILRTVYGLVGSGMRGRMRDGDTIGVWTFNDTLYTGQLGLQDWSNYERRPVAERIVTFLQGQHFEKRAKLESVVPAMLHVIKASEFVTVVLVSDGTDEVHGTPFDKQINQSFKTWSSQQEEAKMPFVTVLQGAHGAVTAFTVAPIPWPVDLPALPADLVAARAALKHPPAPAVKPAPRAAAPLIISGRKPEAATSEKHEGDKAQAASSTQATVAPTPLDKPQAQVTHMVVTNTPQPALAPPQDPAPTQPTAETALRAPALVPQDHATGEKSASASNSSDATSETTASLNPVFHSEHPPQSPANEEGRQSTTIQKAESPVPQLAPNSEAVPNESSSFAPEGTSFPY
ncbi:MAG TPA: hypothetical protein VHI52_22550, partial [Verrucomicrobiae bacterium]|nr:hypothetical protein [Verrucomicrobiae bacterium]